QRLTDADITLIVHIEIARTIAYEILRAVLNDGFLCNQPLFESQAINEGLERRTGRAHGAGHIDPALPLAIEIVSGANLTQNIAVTAVGQHHGYRNFRPEL